MTNEKWLKLYQVLLFVGLIVGATGGLGNYFVDKKIKQSEDSTSQSEKNAKALTGIIINKDKQTPIAKIDTFTVDYGGGVYVVYVNSKQNKPVSFDLFGEGKKGMSTAWGLSGFEPFRITYENNKLFISTKVLDTDEKIICEMDKNQWSVNEHNYYRRNYDDKAVEVIDQYGNVAFSVELVKRNLIELRGIFMSHNGDCILLAGEGFEMLVYGGQQPTSGNGSKISQRAYNAAARAIPKKFIYTGKDYLGKRLPKQFGLSSPAQ